MIERCVRAVVAAVVAAVILQPAPTLAWGPQGHRLVALLANDRLTPLARRNIVWLLGPESMADVSSWADRYNNDVYQTFYWHFVNIPAEATSYDRDRDCLRQPTVEAGSRADKWRDCAVDRILYNRQRIADTGLDRSDRAIALKFLIHFVGDLHQPFHGLGVGHGGNDVPVSHFGVETCGERPCNLHGVWDSALIAHRALDDAQYLAVLTKIVATENLASHPPGTPAEWAMESHDLGMAALLQPHADADETYYRAHIAVVDRRMAQAGVRLAAVLNDVFTSAPPEW